MEYKVTREYLERRYRESLSMAEQAADPAIARVHREFAAKYANAIEEMEQSAETPRAKAFSGGGAAPDTA